MCKVIADGFATTERKKTMSTTFKRTVARGFTLIELLIVVIIVAILAAIVVPQFANNTGDAQMAALDANLAAVRSSLEQYRLQHNNVYPGRNAATGAEGCPAGGAPVQTGNANSREALVAQLQFYSDADGHVCTAQGGNFRFGPYLRQGLPVEPINNSNAVAIFSVNGGPIVATTDGGWAYNTISGQFIMNSTATDTGDPGRQFSAH